MLLLVRQAGVGFFRGQRNPLSAVRRSSIPLILDRSSEASILIAIDVSVAERGGEF